MPYTDYGASFGDYDFHEPWDSPNNRKVTNLKGTFAPLSCFPVQARPSIPERHSRKEVITVLISAAWDHSGRSPTTEKRPS
jgi:hypothetical protein